MCDKGGYTSSDKEGLAAPLAVQQNHAHTHKWFTSLWNSTQKTHAFSVEKATHALNTHDCFLGTSVMPQEAAD